jgi:hypothetical protein
MQTRRSRLVLAFALLMAVSGVALADDPHKPAAPDPAIDDELLEFLGSVDNAADTAQPDDGTWIDYLSHTDLGSHTDPGKVAAKPDNPTVIAAKPATPPAEQKPSTSGEKQNE